jgi:hypothetical protein
MQDKLILQDIVTMPMYKVINTLNKMSHYTIEFGDEVGYYHLCKLDWDSMCILVKNVSEDIARGYAIGILSKEN